MKNNKITVVFDKEDARKFDEIAQRTKWTDKFVMTIALRHYHAQFASDWKKAVLDALEDKK